MAQIVINEISQNYTYNIGTNSYATVAMPITASWGPGYEDPFQGGQNPDEPKYLHDDDDDLENVVWTRFPSTSNGLQSFVQSYRGPIAEYRLAKDYSYQMAMTLMTAGYDVLVCRVATGTRAEGVIVLKEQNTTTNEETGEEVTEDGKSLPILAKYLGSFGNHIKVRLSKYIRKDSSYMNLIVYTLDQYGVSTAVENFVFTFDFEKSTDAVPYIGEIESNFIKISNFNSIKDEDVPDNFSETITLGDKEKIEASVAGFVEGTDYPHAGEGEDALKELIQRYMSERFTSAETMNPTGHAENDSYDVYQEKLIEAAFGSPEHNEVDPTTGEPVIDTDTGEPVIIPAVEATINPQATAIREFSYYAAMRVYTLLSDKLTYNPNRIISPGWDDQDFVYICNGDLEAAYSIVDEIGTNPGSDEYDLSISPIHIALMNAAYLSRCATSYIDIPRSLMRSMVYSHPKHPDPHENGYAQKLGNFVPTIVDADGLAIELDSSLYPTHSALFAPWGQYTMVGMSKVVSASPSLLALMIQRAQILNQAAQYEWALPTNRKHNLRIGKLDYVVPKKLMDIWQSLEGVGVNIITAIPDLGVNLWGNSTLYDVPPATYQALANLSTRLLVNAVEDVAY